MTPPPQGNGEGEQVPSPYGPPSPLEAASLSKSLGAPVSRGFVLATVLVLLLALGWVDHRQQARLDQVEQYTSSAISMSTQFVPPSGADPATCWLLGTLANAQGQGALVAQWASNGTEDDCKTSAARGARGQALDGN